jgi:hypothetical protein
MDLVYKLNDFYRIYQNYTEDKNAASDYNDGNPYIARMFELKDDICKSLLNRIPLEVFKEPIDLPNSPKSRKTTRRRTNASPIRRGHRTMSRLNINMPRENENIPIVLPGAVMKKEKNSENEERSPRNIRSYFKRQSGTKRARRED